MNCLVLLIILVLLILLFISTVTEHYGHRLTRNQLKDSYTKIMKIMDGRFEPILFFGSLLGYIRENDFIEGDNDIDLVVNIKYRDQIIQTLKYNNIGISRKEKDYLRADDIDFYFYWIDEKGRYHQPWDGPPTRYCFTTNDIFPLTKVNYMGFNISIPNKPEEVLSKVYTNWKTPDSSDNLSPLPNRDCFKEVYGES